MSQDFYKLLEVAADASPEEIQKAYRRLARKYHPDLNPDDKSAQQKFKDIQNAYDVLNDPEKRKMYDQFGPDFHRMGGDPFGGGAYPGGGGAYPGGGGAYPGGGGEADYEKYFRGGGAGPQGGFGFGSLDELLKQFGGGARTGGRGRGQTASPATQGADLRTELAVSFQTAALGGTAALNVVRGGKEETIQIKIPPGVTSGKKMRLRGQGNPGSYGGPNGDLIVLLHVAPHPHFRRNGNNLELSLPISLKEAIMGATVDVPTPNGTVALKIPPGSSGGRRLRIRGQGALSSSGPPGDLYVELQIRLPERLLESEQRSPEIQNALDQLDSMYREPMRKHIQW